MPQTAPPEDPKSRILQAAKELFAQKGYAATGLRELSATAGVNLAMVHYYFGSKAGILEAIFEEFFAQLSTMVTQVERLEGPPEARIRTFVEQAVQWHRANPWTIRIVLTEVARENPDIPESQVERAREIFTLVERLFPLTGDPTEPPVDIRIIGPAVGGALLWHFLLRPLLKRVFQTEFDDTFYKQYTAEITQLLARGLLGRLDRNGKE